MAQKAFKGLWWWWGGWEGGCYLPSKSLQSPLLTNATLSLPLRRRHSYFTACVVSISLRCHLRKAHLPSAQVSSSEMGVGGGRGGAGGVCTCMSVCELGCGFGLSVLLQSCGNVSVSDARFVFSVSSAHFCDQHASASYASEWCLGGVSIQRNLRYIVW